MSYQAIPIQESEVSNLSIAGARLWNLSSHWRKNTRKPHHSCAASC
jgi:hypothetical protein